MRYLLYQAAEFQESLGQAFTARLMKLGFGAALLGALAGFAASTLALKRAMALDTKSHAAIERRFAAPLAATTPASGDIKVDFVSELPRLPVDDQEIRFASKLANEQSVLVLQIQSKALQTDRGHLPRHGLTLQLRGEYRDIKNVWIALLEKFPGLTLERLAIRHHVPVDAASQQPVGGALPPADRSDDEATIEMIQYMAPDKAEA